MLRISLVSGLVAGALFFGEPALASPVVTAEPYPLRPVWRVGVEGGLSAVPTQTLATAGGPASPALSFHLERRLIDHLWLTTGVETAAGAMAEISNAQIVLASGEAAQATHERQAFAGWFGARFGLRPVLNPGAAVEFFGNAQVTTGVLGRYVRGVGRSNGALGGADTVDERGSTDLVGRVGVGAGAEYGFTDTLSVRALADAAVWLGGPFSQNELGASLALEPRLALSYRF